MMFVMISVLVQSIAHAQCSTSWTMLQPGIDFRQITCLGEDSDAQRHHASFAINPNFFDRHYEPIGAIVRGGTLVHAPHRSG
jgi:uncharacterized protein YigE (DUF2233 family)